MSAKRTGTIVMKPSGAFARVWVKLPDGTEERRWMNLQTKDRTTAKRKLARLVAMLEAGELVAEAQAKTHAPESYKTYTLDRNEKRTAAGVVMANDEQNNRVRFIYPVIGDMPLSRVTDDHVRQVLENARDHGLAWETVRKIRAVMSRDFKRARIEKLIAQSPVQDVGLPEGLKRDKRPRGILTDDEIARYLGTAGCDLELKMLAIVARTEGGMRTAELIRWDWMMIDTVDFAACTIARAKTGDVQRLEVPEMLRAFLRGWWERAGKPAAGPVFPVRRGPRVGQIKKGHNTSFAKRLRRELFRAGVVRLPPVPDKDGKPVPNPADPIYFDTRISKRVDFHSFRRAYNTALARAGVNLQQAMVFASHSDAKTHMGYVMAHEATKPLPAAALPQIDPAIAASLRSPVGDSSRRRTPILPANTTMGMLHGEAGNALSCATLSALPHGLLSRGSVVRVHSGVPRSRTHPKIESYFPEIGRFGRRAAGPKLGKPQQFASFPAISSLDDCGAQLA
jgi:integrase